MIIDFDVIFGKPRGDLNYIETGNDMFVRVWPQKENSFYEDDEIFSVVKGYFLNDNKGNYSKLLADLYKKSKKQFIEKLDGVFTAFIYDKHLGKAYFFQDSYGPAYQLFYAKSEDGLVVSTSLKSIIDEIDAVEFDFVAARDFLSARNLIVGKRTLIKDINKLAYGEILSYDIKSNQSEVFISQRQIYESSKKQARTKLLASVETAIKKISEVVGKDKTGMALSGGYDTNLNLYFLSKNYSGVIETFTVAGKIKDESGKAGLSAGKYKNTNHERIRIGEDALDFLPDIVRRLQGNVCESGIILQYFMAKKIAETGNGEIILGDGADQILDPNIEKFSAFKEKIKSTKIGDLIYRLLGSHQRKSRYFQLQKKLLKNQKNNYKIKNLQLQFILKKSALMLASFGIQGYYPFLNRETDCFSRCLGLENLNKKFYKKQVEKLFKKEGLPLPQKMGGSTDIEYLLEHKKEEIKKIIGSDFIARIIDDGKILDEINNDYLKLPELALLLLYLYFFNLIFVEKIENPVF